MPILCNNQLINLAAPVVMGILNVTPDSFFDGGRYDDVSKILHQAENMLVEGAVLLDIGGASSRPGAAWVSAEEEMKRVLPAIEAILNKFPQALISIDTWRAAVAERAVGAGACLVNDISAGNLDPLLFETLAELKVPYILMHMQGEPGNMQAHPKYGDVTLEVLDFFIQKIERLRSFGIQDILLDPGFGFGKTVAHNFALLQQLSVFEHVLGLPVLAGISRKSMICKPLGISPKQALNGTTALHMVALQQGAKILRAHDVREAVEVIQLWQLLDKTPHLNTAH